MSEWGLGEWLGISIYVLLLLVFGWRHLKRVRLWLRGPAYHYGPIPRQCTPLTEALHRAQAGEVVGWSVGIITALLAWIGILAGLLSPLLVAVALAGLLCGYGGMLWTSAVTRSAYRRYGSAKPAA